jgi:hypothetical protein
MIKTEKRKKSQSKAKQSKNKKKKSENREEIWKQGTKILNNKSQDISLCLTNKKHP